MFQQAPQVKPKQEERLDLDLLGSFQAQGRGEDGLCVARELRIRRRVRLLVRDKHWCAEGTERCPFV